MRRRLVFFCTVVVFTACTKPVFKSTWTKEIAPAGFVTRFETSKGNFDVEVKREWSPKAVDRFYQLIRHHFYDNAVFYRIVPGFVAQFGNSDTLKTEKWGKFKIPDEQVIQSNKKGTLSFARAGKETRGRELFINLVDNPWLDTLNYAGVKGFPAFGNVIMGAKTVDSLYGGYGEQTMDKLDTFYVDRSKFMDSFPKLDLIRKAYILIY